MKIPLVIFSLFDGVCGFEEVLYIFCVRDEPETGIVLVQSDICPTKIKDGHSSTIFAPFTSFWLWLSLRLLL